MELEALFSPRAVAVIGASNRELTIGYRIIENLLDFGYTGAIYPVNPKGGEIRGLRAYSSILDVPEGVDVAHIVIRNKHVPGCIEDCARKGVKAVIVNTAGFREIGGEGAVLEDQLLAVANRTGIRVFGPNCQGIINTDDAVRAYCNFTFTRPTAGNISIVAQSGGVGEVIHQRIVELGVGLSLYASNGNACDVSIPEIIRHFGRDERTKVIVVHIESLSDPRAFLEAATEVARHKPILGMKVGRTAEGAKAVSSHTGGMIKQDTAVELVFDKAGVVAFHSIEELCQSAIGFACQPVPEGNRVGMIANTGGPAIIATDELIEGGMVMPALSKKTETLLREKLYPEASINNPIDVLATAGPEHFSAAITALMDDDGIDAIFLNFVTPFFVDTLGVAREIAEANRRSHKPIVATVMTEKKGWAETLKIIRDSGVPTYDMPETGARVLASMGKYAAFLKRSTGAADFGPRGQAGPDQAAGGSVLFANVNPSRARSIIKTAGQDRNASPRHPQGVALHEPGVALREEGVALLAAEGFDLFTCYGIPVARYASADDVEECIAAADEIGYPVALKVDAQSVVHKTDSGGVALGVHDREALRKQAQHMLSKFAEVSPKLLVQEQLPPGREIIIGAKAVEGLGHIVMFGLGGIFVEVLKDVSFKITPVSRPEAFEMIESLQTYPLLSGVRGQAGVDLPALVEVIQRLSQMLVDNPEIRELDINPLFAFEHDVKAVDARVFV